jgi:phosphatidylglycerol:prolipoprotein diacylglycerol transferase
MHNDLFSIGGVTIHGYGLMIAIGFAVAIAMSYIRAKAYGLRKNAIIDIALLAMIFGFLGAKLFYVIVEYKAFFQDPLSVLGSDGFVVYGGIIGGVAAAFIYCRIKRISFLSYFGLAIPSVAVAQGFGRIGCFLAGCCYGCESTFLGIIFPEGSIAPAGIPLLPTQLISSAGDFLIALVLILYARKSRIKGNVGALYLLLYGIGRFVIEFFRNDVRGSVGVLSTSQFISLFFVLGAVAMFVINAKRAVPADMILDKEERKEADRRNQEEEHKFKELKKSGKNGKIESIAESEEAGKKDETTNESEN